MKNTIKKSLQVVVIGLLTYCTVSVASPQSAAEDAKITEFIAKKISEIKLISQHNIHIKTENHNVTFTGVVNNMEDAHKIVEIVTPLPEVNKIDISHLQIKDATV
jgi:osmotically-inducible protein OsmY